MRMMPDRRWRSPPLALQILALLLGGLVVAQLVTLLLTVVLPPAPKRQYGLDDIAAALRSGGGEAGAARLERREQPGPPDVSGPGWLVSERSRRDLARLLGVDDAAVSLAFYTPLPFAGTTSARPVPPLADDGPSAPAATIIGRMEPHASGGGVRLAALLLQAPGGGGGPPPPPPPPSGTAPVLPPGAVPPRDGFPPGMMPGRSPGSGSGSAAPGRGRAFDIAPPARGGRTGTALYEVDPRPVAVGQNGVFIPGDGGAAVPPLLNGGTGSIPPVGAPANGGGSSGPPPRESIPGGAGPGGPALRGALDGAINTLPPLVRPPVTAPPVETPPLLTVPSVAPVNPVPRAAPVPTIAPPPVPYAPLPTVAAAVETAPRPAVAPQLPYGPPIPIAPAGRALFGLAPAPFVEGDFVAALRLTSGRWVVVQPAAEPFPNAWQRRVLLWFALAFAIVAPVGWLFARRLVTPLQRFAGAAEALGRDPSAAILPLDGPAEIGGAAHAFNLMQSRLRSFVDDRTAMIGAISHDLRTPLTRMRFRIEDTDGEVRDGLLEEVDAMEAMITQVIAFIRDASVPGVRERLDLGTLVEDVVEDAQMVGRDVTLAHADAAPVEVDVLGIRRVLDNLLENATKYGARARVRLTAGPDSVVAEIHDDGPGLPEDELERVFEPFYRGASARASDKAGSGLGLAVCRSIARAHGGDVRLLRSAEGFVAEMRLPRAYGLERSLAA